MDTLRIPLKLRLHTERSPTETYFTLTDLTSSTAVVCCLRTPKGPDRPIKIIAAGTASNPTSAGATAPCPGGLPQSQHLLTFARNPHVGSAHKLRNRTSERAAVSPVDAESLPIPYPVRWPSSPAGTSISSVKGSTAVDANDPSVGEHARPTVTRASRASRASIESWPLRWKVAATLVLPILLAATFGAVRIYNELLGRLAAEPRVRQRRSSWCPAVELVDRLDGLAYAAASGAPLEQPLAQFDQSAKALDALITSAEFDPTAAAQPTTASSTAKTLRDDLTSGPLPQRAIAERASNVASGVVSAIATTTGTRRRPRRAATRGPTRGRTRPRNGH